MFLDIVSLFYSASCRDSVESEGKLSAMEINALSTSGWYDCDIDLLVDAILDHEDLAY